MFSARPQKNLIHAKQYFREHLAHGDYYSENQKVRGVWFGKGTVRLGLVAGQAVDEKVFVRLCDNRHPFTREKLTVRQRKQDRRVFFDFAVAPPKSVSVMALVAGDERLLDAHNASSLAAVAQLEQLTTTRVRRDGQVRDRVTGEIVAAAFQHDASRSLDPQLHTHFVVFNATWDDTEQRWKALEPRRMFDAMNFLTEVYRNEMTHRLQAMGYSLRSTKQGFEIQGVSEEIIQRFSKRRQAILAESERLEVELKQVVSNNSRAAIAHHLRERKLRDLGATELRALQRAQLSEDELWDPLESTCRHASLSIL